MIFFFWPTSAIDIMEMQIWMISIQFASLFAVVRGFLFTPLCAHLFNRTQREVSDVSYFMRETHFLRLLLQMTTFEEGTSQVTKLTDRTLQSFLTWIVGRVKRKLPTKEPLQNNFRRNISFTDVSLKFDGNFENMSIDRLSTLEQHYLRSSTKNRTVEFGFRIPHVEMRDTAYELNGQIYNFNVHGKGFINMNVTGLEINGTCKYSLNRWKNNARIQFKQMRLHYWMDAIQIRITGLEVPPIIADTINPLVSSIMTGYLLDQEEYISPQLSETVRIVLNERLKKSNIIRILRFIREWII